MTFRASVRSRRQPIAANDPTWSKSDCNDAGAALTVDGALEVSYPAFDAAQHAHCVLSSTSAPSRGTYQLDVDVTATTAPSGPYAILAELVIDLGVPNAAGVRREYIQLLIHDGLDVNVVVVAFAMPDGLTGTPTLNLGYDAPGPGSASLWTYDNLVLRSL